MGRSSWLGGIMQLKYKLITFGAFIFWTSVWNIGFPDVQPWEDIFASTCIGLFLLTAMNRLQRGLN